MRRTPVAIALLIGLVTTSACGENVVEPLVAADAGTASNSDSGTPPSSAIDILIVADNTGSMCQEQAALQDGLPHFVDQLIDADADFHIGITTTHMLADYRPEPVAKPGQLQATPQPVPGFDTSCLFALDAAGEVVEGDYEPVREAFALAATCAGENPADYAWSDNDIECVVNRLPNCSICPDGTSCNLGDLAPTNYPDFPKVLRAADYRQPDGTIDRDSLLFDFRCASLVGTRGYGIEKGLEAASLAVSRDLTGGAVGVESADTTAPNHGLFRTNSRFAVLFVTDENDCANVDGDEATACGGDVCEYWNASDTDDADTPLIAVEDLQQSFLNNLSDTVERAVSPDEVTILSLHGPTVRLDTTPADIPSMCSMAGYQPPPFPCIEPKLGRIGSGDRYGRFAALFPNTYPAVDGGVVPGTLCTEPIETTLAKAATALVR
jgi:hypothetical protein